MSLSERAQRALSYFQLPVPYKVPDHFGGVRVRMSSKRVKTEKGAMATGGNSARALRLALKNRYGQEQWKIRYPTHYQYCLRLLTFTTGQIVSQNDIPGVGAPATPTTDTAVTRGYDVRPEGGAQPYHQLNPRVADSATNGEMSLNSCGLYWVWAEHLPDPTCPWLETYFAFKLDAQGFNLCDPTHFANGCTQYEYVKQGPYCATFVWPDMPIQKAGPVRRYYNISQPTFSTDTNTGTISSYAAAHMEERGIGVWEMIIIPPRRYKSVNIDIICDQDGWDRLIDMGFKPRPAQRVTKIYCSNSGLDQDSADAALAILEQPAVREYNDAAKFNVGDMKQYKMRYLDTEEVCQYWGSTVPDQPNMRLTQYPTLDGSNDTLKRQGYPCVPFGSAVVFRCRQFAPVQQTVTEEMSVPVVTTTQTCIRQTIPLDIYLDSVTSFKSPVKGQFDLDLPFTNPASLAP